MFHLLQDKTHKILYIIKFKTGGSLLHNISISGKYNKLMHIGWREFSEAYQENPKIKIVTTLREPKSTYFSGLHQLFSEDWHARAEHTKTQPAGIESVVSHYSREIKKQLPTWETKLPLYDFSDGHCSHHLWVMLCLIVSGCNVSIIELHKYSEYLYKYYPGCKDLIKKVDDDSRKSPESYSKTSSKAFNNIIYNPQKESNNPNTWENWMSLEIAAFDAIMVFLTDKRKQDAYHALSNIGESNIYWNRDPLLNFYPNANDLVKLLGKDNLPDSIVVRANAI